MVEHASAAKQEDAHQARQAKLLLALHKLTQANFQQADEQGLLHAIAEVGRKTLRPSATSALLMYQPDMNLLQVVEVAGRQLFLGKTVRPGEGASGMAYQRMETVYIEGYSTWTGRTDAFSQSDEYVLATPLRVNQTVFGVITLADPKPFSPEDIELWEIFAAHTALVLGHARYTNLTDTTNRKTSHALHLSRLKHAPLFAIQELLKNVLEHTKQILPYDHAIFAAYRNQELTYFASIGVPAFEHNQPDLLNEKVFTNIIKEMVTPDPNYALVWETFAPDEAASIRDGFVVSLDVDSPILGLVDTAFIAFGSKDEAVYTKHSHELARVLATTIKSIMRLAALYQAEHIDRRRKDVLLEIAQTLVTSADQGDILEDILARMAKVIPYTTGSLLLFEDDVPAEYIPSVSFDQYNPEKTPEVVTEELKSSKLVKRIYASRKPLIIPSVADEPDWIHFGFDYIVSWMGIPLIAKDDFLGILMLDSAESHSYKDDDLELAEAIGAHISILLTNLRLYAVERKAKQQAEALRQAASSLNVSLSMEDVLETIMTAAERFFEYTSSAIAVVRADDSVLVKEIKVNADTREVSTSVYWSFDDLPSHLAQLLERRAPLILPVSNKRSWFGVPLYAQNRTVGALYIEKDGGSTYETSDVQMAQVLAEHAVTAIQNANRYEAELSARQQFSALLEMSNTVSATLNVDTVLDRIMELAAGFIPFTTSCARLYVDDQVLIRLYGVSRLNENELEVAYRERGQNFVLIEELFRTGKPLIINNTANNDAWVQLDQFQNVHSWMGIPLIADGRRLGTLTFDSRLVDTYTPEHARAAEALASQAVMAIRNAQLFYRTEEALEEVENLFEVSNSLINADTLEELLEVATSQAFEEHPGSALLFYVDNTDEGQTSVTCAASVLGEWTSHSLPEANFQGRLDLSATSEAPGNNPRRPYELMFHAGNTSPQQELIASLQRTLSLPNELSVLFLPLYTNNRWVGFITLLWPHPHELTRGEARFYNVISPLIGAIIENRRLFEKTSEALELSQALYAASHDLINAQSESELLDVLLNSEAMSLVKHAQLTEVYTRHGETYGRVIARVSEREAAPPATVGAEFPLIEYAHTEHVAQGDYAIKVIHDREQYVPPELKSSAERMRLRGDRTLVVVPLVTRGNKLVAVIVLVGDKPSKQTNEQIHFLQVLMPEIASIIEVRQLLKQTREAQLRFEDIALNTSEGVWETSGMLLSYCSPKLAYTLGYSASEILGKPLWRVLGRLFSKRDLHRFLEKIRLGRRIVDYEIQLTQKNGKQQYYVVSAMPVFDANGSLNGYRGVLKNIHERKQTEQRERVAFEIGQHLTSMLSMDDLFSAMLDEMSLILGYDSVFIFLYENSRKQLYPYYHVESGDVILPDRDDIVWDAIQQRRTVLAQNHAQAQQAAFPLILGERVLGVLLVQVEPDERFKPLEIRMLQNLSAQISIAIENARLYRELELQAEHLEELVGQRTGEILQERERLDAIVQNAGEAIVFSRADGVIELANPAFEGITGYRTSGKQIERILIKDMLMYLSPRDEVKQMLRDVQAGKSWRGELRITRPDGSEFDAGLTVAPVFDANGKPIRYVTVIHDVTAQKEVDRMRRKFVANVSHELRTPLANLKLYTTLIRSGEQEKRERYLTIMGEQLGRLERIVEDLLDISRIDRGVTPVNYKKSDLNRLVDNVLRAHELKASERQLELRVLKSSTLPMVNIDPERIMQVITNLLVNAINYSQEGDEIRVQTRGVRQDGILYAALVVSDTGMGISPDDLPFVFNRFFRAETSKVMGVPGTGLGLSIVKEIVEQHNGEIFVSSFIGKGTTFTILLPAIDLPTT